MEKKYEFGNGFQLKCINVKQIFFSICLNEICVHVFFINIFK
jgi:hypothetical protein